MTPGRVLFAVGAVLDVAALAWAAGELPDRVATHFGGSGAADSFASRGVALWTMAGVCLGIAASFAALARYGRRLGWSLVNVPHKAYWSRPENRPRFWRRFAEDIWLIGGLTLLLLAAVQVLTVRANRVSPPALDGWSVATIAVYLVAVLGYCAWIAIARYRPPPGVS